MSAAVAVLFCCDALVAASIPVANHSFELPVVGTAPHGADASWGGKGVDDWGITRLTDDPAGFFDAWPSVNADATDGGQVMGSNVAVGNSSSAGGAQAVGGVLPNQAYELTVDIGRAAGAAAAGFQNPGAGAEIALYMAPASASGFDAVHGSGTLLGAAQVDTFADIPDPDNNPNMSRLVVNGGPGESRCV